MSDGIYGQRGYKLCHNLATRVFAERMGIEGSMSQIGCVVMEGDMGETTDIRHERSMSRNIFCNR